VTAETIHGEVVPLVVLVGHGLDWAIEAQNVLNAQSAAEWSGSPPIDVAALWGARWERGSNATRVVVVSTQQGACAFFSARLAFRNVGRGEILPLPPFVARGSRGRLIRGVVFDESEPTTFVLNPDAFMDNPKHALSDSLQGTIG
jgi:hypothetical protein